MHKFNTNIRTKKIYKMKELEKFDYDFGYFASMCNWDINCVLDDVWWLLGLKNILKEHKNNIEEILKVDQNHRWTRWLAFMYETLFKEELNLPENYLKVEPFNNVATTTLLKNYDRIPYSLSTPVFSQKYNVQCVGMWLNLYIDINNKSLEYLKLSNLSENKVWLAMYLLKNSIRINTKENFELYLNWELDFKDDFSKKLLKWSDWINEYELMQCNNEEITLVLECIQKAIKEFDWFQDFLVSIKN